MVDSGPVAFLGTGTPRNGDTALEYCLVVALTHENMPIEPHLSGPVLEGPDVSKGPWVEIEA
jgi:hypothetical protein